MNTWSERGNRGRGVRGRGGRMNGRMSRAVSGGEGSGSGSGRMGERNQISYQSMNETLNGSQNVFDTVTSNSVENAVIVEDGHDCEDVVVSDDDDVSITNGPEKNLKRNVSLAGNTLSVAVTEETEETEGVGISEERREAERVEGEGEPSRKEVTADGRVEGGNPSTEPSTHAQIQPSLDGSTENPASQETHS